MAPLDLLDRARPRCNCWRPNQLPLTFRPQTAERCPERTGKGSHVEQDRHPVVPDDAFHRHVAHEREICLLSLFAGVRGRLARSARAIHTYVERWSASRVQRAGPDSGGSGGSACDFHGRNGGQAPFLRRSSRQPACGNPTRFDRDLRRPDGTAPTVCSILLGREVRSQESEVRITRRAAESGAPVRRVTAVCEALCLLAPDSSFLLTSVF